MKLITHISIIIGCLACFCSVGVGQNPDINRTNHWYFGDKAGIDFNGGFPQSDTNGMMNAIEGCATISDTAGNLLFYTDGDTVWNKNHQVMPNGIGLMGHWSGWQNSVIVPKPGNSNIYYIFTIDAAENGFANGLRYSEVDMTLNSGLGDVTTNKNILLFSPNVEGLVAVHHNNCKDIWVVSHEQGISNDFYAYLVTSSGVNTTPVITNIGNNANTRYGTCLGMKFSPDGSMLAVNNFFDYAFNPALHDTIELYQFDRTNASLSNKILLADTVLWGCSFSPDNKKLYVCTGMETTKIYQYNLSTYSQNAIAASKILIFETDPSTYYLQMQITPNGKIFLDKYDKDTLSVIDSPNLLGASCNYLDNGFSLAGKKATYGLPNFIESFFDTFICSVGIGENSNEPEQIFVYPNPFNESTVVLINQSNFINDNIKIELFDLLGKKQQIQKSEIDYKNNNIEIRVNRGNLKNGLYQLLVIINHHTYTQKLIIIN